MSDVKRYELTVAIHQRETAKPDGEWVKYADHLAALATLTAENARLREDAGKRVHDAFRERDLKDAPIGYSREEALAWCSGYDTAIGRIRATEAP